MIIKLRAKMDRQDVAVKDWSEASSVFRDWIEKNGYGSSNLVRGAGDVVVMGKKIGHVSYNGRLWDLSGAEIVIEVGQ